MPGSSGPLLTRDVTNSAHPVRTLFSVRGRFAFGDVSQVVEILALIEDSRESQRPAD